MKWSIWPILVDTLAGGLAICAKTINNDDDDPNSSIHVALPHTNTLDVQLSLALSAPSDPCRGGPGELGSVVDLKVARLKFVATHDAVVLSNTEY